MKRQSVGPPKPGHTLGYSHDLSRRFMSEHGQAPYAGPEDAEAVTGRSRHLEAEAVRMTRDLKSTLHCEVCRQRLAAAWSGLCRWCDSQYRSWDCATVLAQLPCAIFLLYR